MGWNGIAAEAELCGGGGSSAALRLEHLHDGFLFFLTMRQKRGRGGKGREKAIFPAFIFQECISRIAASDGGEYFVNG